MQGSIDPIPDLFGYPPLKVWDTITQDVMLGQQCQPIVVMAHSNDKITRLIGEENNSLKALNVDVARPWRGPLLFHGSGRHLDTRDWSILFSHLKVQAGLRVVNWFIEQ
jgi:hypothetical protein